MLYFHNYLSVIADMRYALAAAVHQDTSFFTLFYNQSPDAEAFTWLLGMSQGSGYFYQMGVDRFSPQFDCALPLGKETAWPAYRTEATGKRGNSVSLNDPNREQSAGVHELLRVVQRADGRTDLLQRTHGERSHSGAAWGI